MWSLSDEVLLDAYEQAMELQLDDRFIQMLLAEIRQRDLSLKSGSYSA